MNFIEGAPARALGGDLVGIRPEHLDISTTAGTWAGRLRHAEHLGSETLSYVDVEGIGTMTVKTEGDIAVTPDQPVYLSARPGQLHIFNNGKRQ